jgi:hypothetical protein
MAQTLAQAIDESRATDQVVDIDLSDTDCVDMAALQAEAYALGYETDEVGIGEDIHDLWGWRDNESGKRTAESGRSEWRLRVRTTEAEQPGVASSAARTLRAIPSETRSEASRVNGRKGGRPRKAGTAGALREYAEKS